MTALFDKLNLKDHRHLVVLDAPASFEPELAALDGVTVHRDPAALPAIPFCLAFIQDPQRLAELVRAIAPRAGGDAILWFAYPKGTSKKYRCAINRDTGWEALGAEGFEPVRQVAIDEDWSALRFRRTEFIKTLRRDPARALSPAGKRR
jgi:hypothetical protein